MFRCSALGLLCAPADTPIPNGYALKTVKGIVVGSIIVRLLWPDSRLAPIDDKHGEELRVRKKTKTGPLVGTMAAPLTTRRHCGRRGRACISLDWRLNQTQKTDWTDGIVPTTRNCRQGTSERDIGCQEPDVYLGRKRNAFICAPLDEGFGSALPRDEINKLAFAAPTLVQPPTESGDTCRARASRAKFATASGREMESKAAACSVLEFGEHVRAQNVS